MKNLATHINESFQEVNEAFKPEQKVKLNELFKDAKDLINTYKGSKEIDNMSSFSRTFEMPDGSFIKCEPVDNNGKDLISMDAGKSKYDYDMIVNKHYYDANAGKKGKPKYKDIK